jgi:hypothetical protein
MPIEVSRRKVRLSDSQNFDITLITYDDGSVGMLSGGAAPSADVQSVSLNPDARNAALGSIEITLSGTPGTVTVVTLPDYARGFRLFPRSNACRFAIGQVPAAVATVATGDQVVAAADFAVGGIAKADGWEVRLLVAGTARTLQISSITASLIVDVECF